MRRLLPTLSLLVVAFTACSPSSGAGPSSGPGATRQPPPREVSEPDILEAVFRYQFEHNASGLQKSAERYCLSVEGDRMPSADFLRRFAGHTPPVTSADQCDRTTGRDLFFLVKDIQRQGENEVWVRGGYWEGNLSSSGELYIVGRENGKWVVKESRMEMIS